MGGDLVVAQGGGLLLPVLRGIGGLPGLGRGWVGRGFAVFLFSRGTDEGDLVEVKGAGGQGVGEQDHGDGGGAFWGGDFNADGAPLAETGGGGMDGEVADVLATGVGEGEEEGGVFRHG